MDAMEYMMNYTCAYVLCLLNTNLINFIILDCVNVLTLVVDICMYVSMISLFLIVFLCDRMNK